MHNSALCLPFPWVCLGLPGWACSALGWSVGWPCRHDGKLVGIRSGPPPPRNWFLNITWNVIRTLS